MLSVLTWALAALLCTVAAIVALPVTLRLRLASMPRQRAELRVALLGGLAPAITLLDSDRRKVRASGKSPASLPNPRSKNGFPSLVVDLLSQVRLLDLTAEGAFGFDDPADTGFAYGLLAPLRYGAPPCSRIHVDLRPVFDRACLSGRLDTTVAFTPARLVPPVLRHLWRRYAPVRP